MPFTAKVAGQAAHLVDVGLLQGLQFNMKILAAALRGHCFHQSPVRFLSHAEVIKAGVGLDLRTLLSDVKYHGAEGRKEVAALFNQCRSAVTKGELLPEGTVKGQMARDGIADEIRHLSDALQETLCDHGSHYLERALSGRHL